MMKSLHVPAETDVDTEEDDWITAEIQRELSELNSDDLDSASDLEDEPKEEEDDLWLDERMPESMMNYMTFIQGQNRKFADLQEELLECDQVLQEAEILTSRDNVNDDRLQDIADDLGVDVMTLKKQVLDQLDADDDEDSRRLSHYDQRRTDDASLEQGVTERWTDDASREQDVTERRTDDASREQDVTERRTDDASRELSSIMLIKQKSTLSTTDVPLEPGTVAEGDRLDVCSRQAGACSAEFTLLPGEGSVVHVCDSDVLEVKLRNELLELERKNEKNVKLQNQEAIVRKEEEERRCREEEKERRTRRDQLEAERERLERQRQADEAVQREEACLLEQQQQAEFREHQMQIEKLAQQNLLEQEQFRVALRQREEALELRRRRAAIVVQTTYRAYRVRLVHGKMVQDKINKLRKKREDARLRVIEEKIRLRKIEDQKTKDEQLRIKEEQRLREEKERMEEEKREREAKRKQEEDRMKETKRKEMEEKEAERRKEGERQKEENKKKEEEKRKECEKRKEEEKKKEEEKQKVDERRKEEEKLKEEERRKEEEKKKEKAKRKAEEKEEERRKDEEKLKEEERRKDEEKLKEDEKRKEEEKLKEDEKRKEEEKKKEEANRKEKEKYEAGEKRKEEERNAKVEARPDELERLQQEEGSAKEMRREGEAVMGDGEQVRRDAMQQNDHRDQQKEEEEKERVDESRRVGAVETQTETEQRAISGGTRETGCGGVVDCGTTDVTPGQRSQTEWGEYLPPSVDGRRVAWMKLCTPWSKTEGQLKKRPECRKVACRPASTKGLPLIDLNRVMLAAKHDALHKVTLLELNDLETCNLQLLSQCTQLKALVMHHCHLVTLQGLAGCQQLQYVSMKHNLLETVSLPGATSLRILDLTDNRLASIHGLEDCGSLRILRLRSNSISRLGGLVGLTRLHSLDLSDNQLTTTRGLDSAPTLQTLTLSRNHLCSVEGLQPLGLLRELHVSGSSLVQVPVLANQVLLQQLLLDDNNISSMSSLTNSWLPLLEELDIGGNSVSILEDLSHCLLLRKLNVRNNQLCDLATISSSLSGMRSLESLEAAGNPVSEEVNYRSCVLQSLGYLGCLDGATVQPTRPSPVRTAYEGMCLTQQGRRQKLESSFSVAHRSAVDFLEKCQLECRYVDISHQLAVQQRHSHEYGDTSDDTSVDITLTRGGDTSMTSPGDDGSVASRQVTSTRETVDMKSLFNAAFAQSGKRPDADSSATYCARGETDKVRSDSETMKDKIGSSPSSATTPSTNSAITPSTTSAITVNPTSAFTQSATCAITPSTSSAITPSTVSAISAVTNITAGISGNNICQQTAVGTTSSSNIDGGITRSGTVDSGTISAGTNGACTKRASTVDIGTKGASTIDVSTKGACTIDIGTKSASTIDVSTKDASTIDVGTKSASTIDTKQIGTVGSGIVCTPGAFGVTHTAAYDNHSTVRHSSGVKSDSNSGAIEWAATVIQAHWRGYSLRRRLFAALEFARFDDDDDDFDYDEVDTHAFNFNEADFETTWIPPDTPQLPMNHAVLADTPVNTPPATSVPPLFTLPPPYPPAPPREAWRPSSGVGFSPLPPVPGSEDMGRSTRERREKFSEEWGFKDSRTAELMMQRAKKLKYNAVKRRKLSRLDPKQRLALFRRLEQSGQLCPVPAPAKRPDLREDYFKGRAQMEWRQEREAVRETSERKERLFEWLHTQVGRHDGASPSLNRRPNVATLPQLDAGVLAGRRTTLTVSPASMELQSIGNSSVSGEMKVSRRASIQATQPREPFPNIKPNSAPNSRVKEKISWRNPDNVDKSGGWGGGRKRLKP